MQPKPIAKKIPRQVIVGSTNHPDFGRAIDAEKYEEMKRAMMQILPSTPPGMSQAEIRTAVAKDLAPEIFSPKVSVNWWAKMVQIDLEAKGVVVREATKPLRWHLKSP